MWQLVARLGAGVLMSVNCIGAGILKKWVMKYIIMVETSQVMI